MSVSHALYGAGAKTVTAYTSWTPSYASALIWTVLFSIRTIQSDPTASQDLYIALFIDLCTSTASFLGSGSWPEPNLHLVLSFATWLVLLFVKQWQDRNGRPAIITSPSCVSSSWSKPLVFPCRTTHSRSFPEKHSFSYSYLLVGIPVEWQGCAGSLLSAGISRRHGWLHVNSSDFLERDLDHFSLRDKLDHYLASQNTDGKLFPYAYLITAPRVLGYSFNPVSFWYLYSAQLELQAMILEVNNTFGERRIYLLHASRSKNMHRHDTQEHANMKQVNGHLGPSGSLTFTSEWRKDFHVSPFNSREGSYTLVAHDPLAQIDDQPVRVSNTIKLISSEGHVKLVARVFSTSASVNPETCSFVGKLRLLSRYGWVGFITFPRIVKEAKTLFFSKKLIIFFRPEVMDSSISRRATETERLLETFFARYLEYVVGISNEPVRLIYKPAADTGSQREVILCSTAYNESTATAATTTRLNIVSPAFYSRFVHYAHFNEAIDGEYLCTDSKNQTLIVDNLEALSQLFHQTVNSNNVAKPPLNGLSVISSDFAMHMFLDNMRWRSLRLLRCAPAAQSYITVNEDESTARNSFQDFRTLPLSPMDYYVRQHCCSDAYMYRRKITELFLAQRFAAGFPVVISALDWILRALLLWISIIWYSQRSRPVTESAGANLDTGPHGNIANTILFVLASNVIHVWALLKGL